MKILIAVPTFESIRPETFKSIYGLQPYGHWLLFDYVKGYDCARARNMIAMECVRYRFDAVLMIDSDTVVPSNAIQYLAEGDCPIVLGTYPRRGETEGSEVFLPGVKDFTEKNRVKFVTMPYARFHAKGGGFGCAFVRREAFEKIPYPWFRYVEYDNGSVLSEDNYFCDKATKSGFEIQADGRVRCGHITARTMWAKEER